MATLGKLLFRGLNIKEHAPIEPLSAGDYQQKELARLLKKAKNTAFGQHFNFRKILASKNPLEAFQQAVPIYDYEKMYFEWWHRALKEEPDISWPGYVQYFSPGSGAAGQKNPVTAEMIKRIRQNTLRQFFSLATFSDPDELFKRDLLVLGGSQHLNKNGKFFEGKLTGLNPGRIPLWFQHHFKTSQKGKKEMDWNAKIREIVRLAPRWDIGLIAGPSPWIQILLEKIIEAYSLNNIHEIWPNLDYYLHGDVEPGPFMDNFDKLTAWPLTFLKTYINTEGFFGFQRQPDQQTLNLILNNGIFFEFIPYNSENFTGSGDLKSNPRVLSIKDTKAGEQYAMVISTVSGLWRYFIGDVIEFTDPVKGEIQLKGRTVPHLNLFGEELSLNEIKRAIEEVEKAFDLTVKAFTVGGIADLKTFGHQWFLGIEEEVDTAALRRKIDQTLKKLNDHYRTERAGTLTRMKVVTLPPALFREWQEKEGTIKDKDSFPPIIEGDQLIAWQTFLEEKEVV